MFTFEGSCWLTPGEKREAILRLVNDGIIKWDNGRALPLKSGGTTDTYINMRQMRDFPGLISYLADLYENPLRRLLVNRIVEMPDRRQSDGRCHLGRHRHSAGNDQGGG